jgi:hypothetical protein
MRTQFLAYAKTEADALRLSAAINGWVKARRTCEVP